MLFVLRCFYPCNSIIQPIFVCHRAVGGHLPVRRIFPVTVHRICIVYICLFVRISDDSDNADIRYLQRIARPCTNRNFVLCSFLILLRTSRRHLAPPPQSSILFSVNPRLSRIQLLRRCQWLSEQRGICIYSFLFPLAADEVKS